MRRYGLAALMIATAVTGATSTPSPAGPVPADPLAVVANLRSPVENVTFWGLPFPYGYAAPRESCFRHAWVETPEGWRWRRVYVCR